MHVCIKIVRKIFLNLLSLCQSTKFTFDSCLVVCLFVLKKNLIGCVDRGLIFQNIEAVDLT